MSIGPTSDDERLRRATANARRLADEIARRDAAGTWTEAVVVRPTGVRASPWDDPSASAEPERRKRDHVAVVCSDLAGDDVSRAERLAQLHGESMAVDLVGPLWSPPVRHDDTDIGPGAHRIVSFRCDHFSDFIAKAYAVAAHHRYDIVHVCGTGLPGLVLGSLIARACDCPVVVDFDVETPGLDNGGGIPPSPNLDGLHDPMGPAATAQGAALASSVRVRTASSPELLGDGGGIVVRGPGTERAPDPSEFSVEVNAVRVGLAAREAAVVHEGESEALVAATLELARDLYVHERRRERPDLFAEPDPERTEGVDIVFFWKQNDTGIYGRRADMLARHLGSDPRVRRILHLNAPFPTSRAARDAELPFELAADHERLSSLALLDRRLQVIEAGVVHHRSFLYTDEDGADPMSGEPLPDQDGFADFVQAEMAALGIDPARALAWVCPVVFEFVDVQQRLGFAHVVADIIDDQRVFDHTRHVVERFDRHYEEVLGMSTRAFTNCEANAAAFADYLHEITIVPNGAEVSAFSTDRADPSSDDRPVVAYVGNMNDRIDWRLLDELAGMRPDHRLVLVGASHHEDGVHELVERHDNVELLGVIPYAELPQFLRGVDVALVPHLADKMTDRMNPLKVYNYYAAGLPIVSTPIPNLAELEGVVHIAHDAAEFAAAIDRGVEQRRAGSVVRDQDLIESISWTSRASAILDQLEVDGIL